MANMGETVELPGCVMDILKKKHDEGDFEAVARFAREMPQPPASEVKYQKVLAAQRAASRYLESDIGRAKMAEIRTAALRELKKWVELNTQDMADLEGGIPYWEFCDKDGLIAKLDEMIWLSEKK